MHCRRLSGRDTNGQKQHLWVEGQVSHSHPPQTPFPSGVDKQRKQFLPENPNQCAGPGRTNRHTFPAFMVTPPPQGAFEWVQSSSSW